MIVLVTTVAAPVVLFTIPILVFVTVAAYRAQIAGRKQQADIDNLFAATRILSYSKSVTTGAVDFLNHISSMFHASHVELTLLPSSPGGPALVTAPPTTSWLRRPWSPCRTASPSALWPTTSS